MPPVKKPPRDRHATFIAAWRKFRNLSQQKVADVVDVDRTTIGRIEKGESPYDQDILERLAFALQCEPTDLLTIDPNRPDPPRLVYDRLRHAPKEVQDQALRVIEALLRTGT